jgi:hypothetical protein
VAERREICKIRGGVKEGKKRGWGRKKKKEVEVLKARGEKVTRNKKEHCSVQ